MGGGGGLGAGGGLADDDDELGPGGSIGGAGQVHRLRQGVRHQVPGQEALPAPPLQRRQALRVRQVRQEALCGQGGPDDAHEGVRQRLHLPCGIRLCSLGALKRHCKQFSHEPESLQAQPGPLPWSTRPPPRRGQRAPTACRRPMASGDQLAQMQQRQAAAAAAAAAAMAMRVRAPTRARLRCATSVAGMAGVSSGTGRRRRRRL